MSTLSSSSNGHAATDTATPATATAAAAPTTTTTTASSSTAGGITEDEAALYDRQLRLWGVEAQNRMRQAKVLILNFRSLAAEIAKNIVLAGVGQVTLLDDQDVQEEDLGANFFLREHEVGQKRVQAGAPRLRALNPRVELLTRTDAALIHDHSFLSQFDLVVLTDVDAATLVRSQPERHGHAIHRLSYKLTSPCQQRVNASTRRLGKKLYAASSVGIDGWIFADLLHHEFVVDVIKSLALGETTTVPTKRTLSYTPFDSIFSHSWKQIRSRELRKTQPNLWGMLALLEHQRTHPGEAITLQALTLTSQELLPRLGVKTELVPPAILSCVRLAPPSFFRDPRLTRNSVFFASNSQIASTSAFEFLPSAAILGGIAGQDVLNVLGGKEEPVRNLMVFDGQSGAGNVWYLGE
ncbi:BQ2448_7768 [Microbotryum intermedium]|uniref:BQ2448_7768 protein n=1 Tax=Microbotryum intermedium TaxID=269621 RepID=A0A238FPP6_9BASI|nr:BQ2448_7768 [Microbotryum intermedium]